MAKGKVHYTVGLGIGAIFLIAFTLSTKQLFNNLLFLPISYIYLAIKFPGDVRKNILTIIVGVVIYAASLLILNVNIMGTLVIGNPDLIHTLYLLSAIIHTPGIIIFGLGVKRMYFDQD